MLNIPSVRLTYPLTTSEEISRKPLINKISSSPKKLLYVNASAGYGKTTLLAQLAKSAKHFVWLSLNGENDIFTFINTLCEAIKQSFPTFDFAISEYIPLSQKENFTDIMATAMICEIEAIPENFILIMDDLHTITAERIKNFLACLIKYLPKNIKLYFGSREEPWEDFLPYQVRGDIIMLTVNELAFTREETAQILEFDSTDLYAVTEGWPLAIGCFKVLLENGVSVRDVSIRSRDALCTYLFRECIANLDIDTVNFLKRSASFDELDACMLDNILNIKNARLILENLVSRNIFTVKTDGGFYRYHALFKSSLLKTADCTEALLLRKKAASYYFENKNYARAAMYAINTRDTKLIEKIIIECYRDYIRAGKYNELKIWFNILNKANIMLCPELLLAKGVYYSVIGNFTSAKDCLDTVIPLLNIENKELYFEAMIHQARVIRNFISFEKSNQLLDDLIAKLENQTSETTYSVVIEKIYNLCWNSQIQEAFSLAQKMIELCANNGNLKVLHWFERYLCTIHFFAGRMKESIYYYEKSIVLPSNEQKWLDIHSIGIFAAKAYQMIGDGERAKSIITEELKHLRNTGNYEELWAGYLMAAEIFYQDTFIDKANGKNVSFDTSAKYFALANEYAPLYRKTVFQTNWAKVQQLTYSLIFSGSSGEENIQEIYTNLNTSGAYLKNLVLARLMGYFAATADYPNAIKCASLCIEAGESHGIMLHPTMAYGVLAIVAIKSRNQEKALFLTKRYLKLCHENGTYDFFRMRKSYDSILEFAYDNRIEPEFTEQMMQFAGYKPKKIFIEALGAFTIYGDSEKQTCLKFRTKKERELLAFLLDVGNRGATKEQIISAIWWDSESKNIKNLISVNLSHIKNDFENVGIRDVVLCNNNRYFINRCRVECDTDLFMSAYEKLQLNNSAEQAQQLFDLYKGEYLSDFEALWAISSKIKYHDILEKAKLALIQ